jgi:hypothetical protein
MAVTPPPKFWTRQRILLVIGFVTALALTLFFGGRFIGRLFWRPNREPIREWMSIPYVGRAYGFPPPVLYEAIGMVPNRDNDHTPIRDLAQQLNLTSAELIQKLEARIAQGPPPELDGPPGGPRP